MPSPLREQIAHAIWAEAHPTSAGPLPDEWALAQRQADAVLPLVEAAAAAERRSFTERAILCECGCCQWGRESIQATIEYRVDEARAAERLRLHTQLRDLRDPITDAIDKRLRPYAHGRSSTVAVLAAGDVIALLLGVAATPPEATDA